MSFVIFSSRYLIFIVNLNNVNKGKRKTDQSNYSYTHFNTSNTASWNFNMHCVIGNLAMF